MAIERRDYLRELNPKQMLAVGYFARGHTNKQIAETIGVTEATICNWRRNEVFNQAIYQEQQQLFEQIGGRTLTTVLEAISTLREIMTDTEASDANRIAAARAIISGSNTFSEQRAIESQLTEIEALFRRYMGEATEPAALPPDSDALIDILPVEDE